MFTVMDVMNNELHEKVGLDWLKMLGTSKKVIYFLSSPRTFFHCFYFLEIEEGREEGIEGGRGRKISTGPFPHRPGLGSNLQPRYGS